MKQQKYYSTKLTRADIESRVLKVVSAYDKITADKVNNFLFVLFLF